MTLFEMGILSITFLLASYGAVCLMFAGKWWDKQFYDKGEQRSDRY